MCCVSAFFHRQPEEKHLTFNNIIKGCACQVAVEEWILIEVAFVFKSARTLMFLTLKTTAEKAIWQHAPFSGSFRASNSTLWPFANFLFSEWKLKKKEKKRCAHSAQLLSLTASNNKRRMKSFKPVLTERFFNL